MVCGSFLPGSAPGGPCSADLKSQLNSDTFQCNAVSCMGIVAFSSVKHEQPTHSSFHLISNHFLNAS